MTLEEEEVKNEENTNNPLVEVAQISDNSIMVKHTNNLL